jgi:hypothetical protein
MINNTAISNKIVTHARQILFIDSQVEDIETLVAGVIPGIEVVVLESDRNGIEQITEVLSQRNNFTSIHIVSHGSPGCLYLGNTQLSLDTLNKYQSELKTWFNPPAFSTPPTLTKGGRRGDLLVYGCNVATGDAGAEFIAKLNNITGAEIAASTSLTGNPVKGGNWDLEFTTKNFDTLASAFQPDVMAAHSGILAINIGGPTTNWKPITPSGTNSYDFITDQQTGGNEGDLVGNTNDELLYTQFDGAGTTSLTDGTLAFRVRLGADENPTGFSRALFVGIDANGDGKIDLFVGVNNQGNSNVIGIWNPGTGLNNSPSTTSIVATPLASYTETAANYNFAPVNNTIDPGVIDVDLNNDPNVTKDTDQFLSFSLPLADIISQLTALGVPNVNETTAIRYIIATSQQGNSLNQDIGGVDKAGTSSTSTWTQLGAFSNYLSANGNTAPTIDLNGTGTTGINYNASFTENSTPINIANVTSADAADAENNITSLSIVAGGSATDVATETLSIGGQSFALNANRTVTASVGGTTLNLIYTTATRTFAITNNAGATTPIPEANLDTLLRGITYQNTSENPTSGDRTFSFTATDAAGANTASPAVSTITVNPVNDPSVLDLDANDSSTITGANYQTTFTENGSAVSIGDVDTSISDLDNANIASATITLTNAQASDLLAAGSLPAGITATGYNAATGVITLSGSASLASYQTAIRAISFNNTSDNPSATPRTVNVVVSDGTANSNTATTTINVTPVNDAPIIDLNGGDAGTSYSTRFTSSAVNIADAFNATGSDPDGNDIETLTLTVGGVTADAASELLTIGGQSFALNVNRTVTASVGGTSLNLIYTAATRTFGITNNAGATTPINQADLDTLLRGITYQNTSENPTAGDRTITATLNDGASDSNQAVSTIQVPINGTRSPEVTNGTPGNDLIIAGKGEDTLTGGAGNDTYFFNETSEGVDTITDFAKGQDKIDISKILADEVNYTGSNPLGDGYLKLVEFTHPNPSIGDSTIVQIDFNPLDTVYPKDIAFLENVTGITSADFII